MKNNHWNKIVDFVVNPLLRSFSGEDSKGSVWFTVSTGLKTFVQMATSLIVIRMVLPEELGIWKSVVLIQTYISILQFGVMDGLNRQYALYRGAGKDDIAKEKAHVAFTFILLVSLLSGLIVLIIAGVFWFRSSNSKTLIALLLFTLQAMATPLWHYYDTLYRSGHKFSTLGWIQFGESVFLVGSLLLIYFWGWLGMFIRYATVFPVGLLLRYYFRPIPIRIMINWKSLINLSKIGLKVLFSNYLFSLLIVADTTLIAVYLGQEQLGIYSVAITIGGAFLFFPNAVNMIMFSRMAYRIGQSNNAASLRRLAFLPELYNAILLFIPTVILWFTLEPLIIWALPKYIGGITSAKWMVVTGYIMGLNSSGKVFQALNRMKEYIFLLIGALGLMYILGWLGIRNTGTIESVAKVKMVVIVFLTLGINIVSYQMVKSENS